MPERDRIIHPVAGVLAAVFLMLIGAGSVSHAHRYHSKAKVAHKPSTSQIQELSLFTGPSSSAEKQTAEDHKEAREEADLAAQLRMAVAAQNTVYVGLLTLALLGLTVYYARKAWEAAADGTRAAWKSEDTARNIGQAQSRAYIHVPIASIVELGSANAFATPNWYARLGIKNEGSTPAKNVEVHYSFALIEREYEGTVWPLENLKKRFVPNIAPGQTLDWLLTPSLNTRRLQLTEENEKVVTILGSRLHLRVWGEVRYSDIHHRRFASAFQFQSIYSEIEKGVMTASLINLHVFEEVKAKSQDNED